MNFMQLIKSLDDLLYELMSWLVFFPITLWRTIARPLETMDYAVKELTKPSDTQFSETLSPPLFLLVALLLSHGLELSVTGDTSSIVHDHHRLARFVDNDTKLLILRMAVFSTIPLLLAALATAAGRITISDESLKIPFYAQCYPAGPFALALGIGALLLTRGPFTPFVGLAVMLLTVIAYLTLQIVWFRRKLGCSIFLAGLLAGTAVVGGVLFTILIGILFI